MTRYLHVQTEDGQPVVTLRTLTELAHVASRCYADGVPVGAVYAVDGAGVTELAVVHTGDACNAEGWPTHGGAELREVGTGRVIDTLLYAYC